MTGDQDPNSADDAAGADDAPGADDGAVEAVSAANAAFYAAFEAADLDAMDAVWEHSDRVVCTHPGWATLRGWPAVRESWQGLLQGPDRLQFILTDAVVEVAGGAGWVTVDENLLGGSGGARGTVAALNVFVRSPQGWIMVAHHGSPVMARPGG